MNKPVNEKRANAARLPLWMYVLAWLVRTTRLAEHDLNAAPIHGSGATATGDDSPVKERSHLELYAQVIAAYEQAGFWPLFKQAYLDSGNTWRAKKSFWITLIRTLLILWITFIISLYIYTSSFLITSICTFASGLIFLGAVHLIFKDLNKKIEHTFKEDLNKYGSLMKVYSKGREIPRYILFRNTLLKYKFESKDVKNVKPLFVLDDQTLGLYISQKASMIWIASTLTAVLAASATTWCYWFVGAFFAFGLLLLYELHRFSVLVLPGSRQRRQYELNRWLTWYEADAPNLMPANSDDAKPPVD